MARDRCSLPLEVFPLLDSPRVSEGELLELILMSIFQLLQSQPVVESPLSFEYKPASLVLCLFHSHCLLLFCMHLKRNIRLEGWFGKESPWFFEAQSLMTWAMFSWTNVKLEGSKALLWWSGGGTGEPLEGFGLSNLALASMNKRLCLKHSGWWRPAPKLVPGLPHLNYGTHTHTCTIPHKNNMWHIHGAHTNIYMYMLTNPSVTDASVSISPWITLSP